ncbi:MAG: YafY family transcriptional regulator [Oscillospiraceae bacterium]|nr:YafY family transcriptional regulator [Oscillospiraceae bacterium]
MAIDRLIGILAVLLREEQVTAAQLAGRFEVSMRTIQRDIDRLCRAGIPLRTERGVRGGVSIMEGYGLDRTMLTNADRGAILAGLRSLDSVSGTSYYRQLMEKLPQAEAGAADDYVVIDLASWYGPLLAPRLTELKAACLQRRLVRFTYCAPGGDSQRVVEPARLVFRWSSWYLFGWCRERRDWRMFKLTRMLGLETLEESFPPRPVPAPIAPLERIYPDALQAAVRFDPAARWRLIDEFGPESFTQSPDGSLLFRRGFPDREELLRWVLSFQEQAELLEPEDLRRELASRLKKICGKYDSQLSGFGAYHGAIQAPAELESEES